MSVKAIRVLPRSKTSYIKDYAKDYAKGYAKDYASGTAIRIYALVWKRT